MPIITKLFEKEMDLFAEHMFALFDQEFNKPAPEVTGETWGRIRDLSKIWEYDDCQKENFNASNTLVFDCDEISLYECHTNGIVVDEFKRSDVWPIKN